MAIAIASQAFLGARIGHGLQCSWTIDQYTQDGIWYLEEILKLESEKKIRIFGATMRTIETMINLLNEQ